MVGERRRAARRRLHPARHAHRLRRTLVAAVAVAVVVALAVGIAGQVNRQSLPYERSIDLGFAALVGPLGRQSQAGGALVAATLAQATGEPRPALLAALGVEARTAGQLAAQARAAEPPVPVAPLAGDCLQALTLRATVVALVRAAVSAVLGGPTGTATVAQNRVAGPLASAAADVAGADGDWAACRRSLRRSPGVARLPASSWAGGGAWQATALDTDAAAIENAPGLAAAPGLAIDAVSTQPAALAATGSPPVYLLPATADTSVRVVLTDVGNVTLPGVTVRATISGPGPARSPRTVRTGPLAAGSSTVVTVSGLAVVPGSTAVLTVDATADGQSATAPPTSITVSVAQAASLASVTAPTTHVAVGHPVTYTATIVSSLQAAGSPTGTVTFEDAGSPIPGCTAQPLHQGTATCTVTYDAAAAGIHSISVSYGGTAAIAGTTSPAITETVGTVPSSGTRSSGSSSSGSTSSGARSSGARSSGSSSSGATSSGRGSTATHG